MTSEVQSRLPIIRGLDANDDRTPAPRLLHEKLRHHGPLVVGQHLLLAGILWPHQTVTPRLDDEIDLACKRFRVDASVVEKRCRHDGEYACERLMPTRRGTRPCGRSGTREDRRGVPRDGGSDDAAQCAPDECPAFK